MSRRNRSSYKDPSSGSRPSGLAHLMSALHQNAAVVVNSRSELNGPDQVLPSESYVTSQRSGAVKVRREETGLGSEEPISIPTMVQDVSEAYPEVPALKVKRDGKWKVWLYEHFLDDVQKLAKAFIKCGLHRHHSVAIMGQNAPEWVIADLATIFAGGISVGISRELSNDDISKIAIDAKADIIVVENEALLKKILLMQHKLPDLRAIVQIHGEPPMNDKRRLHRSHKKHILSWSQLMEIGQEISDSVLDDRLKRIAVNQCCSLVYTNSDANGSLKGIMLSHDNLTWSAKMMLSFIRAPGFHRPPNPGAEVLLSFLPLSCAMTKVLDIYYTVSVAGTLYFYDGDLINDTEMFFGALAEVQPTIFAGPTFTYERLYHKLTDLRKSMSSFKKLFLDWSSRSVKEEHLTVKTSGLTSSRSLNRLAQWQNSVAKKTICKKSKEALGFSTKTVFISRGNEPIPTQVLATLAGYDIVVHESFGKSENCGLLTANIPKRYCRLGTSGKAAPGSKVKLQKSESELLDLIGDVDDDYRIGEVIAWGRNSFMGYLNKDGDNKSTFTDDGWLQLGQIGLIDSDNFITLLGDPEHLIKLKSGAIVSPQKMEQLIRIELPCVKEVVVVGELKETLAALLTLHTKLDPITRQPTDTLTEEAQRWFKHARFDVTTMATVIESMELGLRHVIQAGIDRANQRCFSQSYVVERWKILPMPFTVQKGELNIDGNLRRPVIHENYVHCIRNLYCGDCDVCINEPKAESMTRPQSLHLQLSQIQEEDESKTSSRNSIDKYGHNAEKSVVAAKITIKRSTSSGLNDTSDENQEVEIQNPVVPEDAEVQNNNYIEKTKLERT